MANLASGSCTIVLDTKTGQLERTCSLEQGEVVEGEAMEVLIPSSILEVLRAKLEAKQEASFELLVSITLK